MGHRANYVLQKNDTISIHYSQYGATSLPVDLLAGPEAFVASVKIMEGRDKLLDNVWCEGAVVLDFDTHNVVFFEDTGNHHFNESPGLRRLYLPILEKRWSGWDINWAERGLADIVAKIGCEYDSGNDTSDRPYAKLTIDDVRKEMGVVEYMVGFPIDTKEYRDGVPMNPYGECVITVCRGPEDVSDYSTGLLPEQLLHLGSQLLPILEHSESYPLPNEVYVGNGVYLSVPEKSIHVWWGKPTDDHLLLPYLESKWPGWSIARHYKGLPGQAELSGRDPMEYHLKPDRACEQIGTMFGFSEASITAFLKRHITKLKEDGATIVHHASLESDEPDFDRFAILHEVLQRVTNPDNPD